MVTIDSPGYAALADLSPLVAQRGEKKFFSPLCRKRQRGWSSGARPDECYISDRGKHIY